MIVSLKVDIDKQMVFRYLGYKKTSKIPLKIEKSVEMALCDAAKYLEPKVVYDEVACEWDTGGRTLRFSRGFYLSGAYIYKHLKNCQSLIAAISTLGNDFDEKIIEIMQKEGAIKAMIYDAIGSAALMNSNRQFWLFLVEELKKRSCGITRQLCPGDNDWPLTEQRVIFKMLDANSIGVSLNDSYVMNPLKSLSMVYGINKDGQVDRQDHDCRECNLIGCIFRQVD